MEQTISVRNDTGENLIATVVRPDNLPGRLPIVIMTPGFGSKRKNSTNTRLTELLVPRGIATVVLDLSGHGDSGGSIEDQTLSKARGEIGRVVGAVRQMDWVDVNRVALLGSSFSGNAMILYAATDNRIRALALKSPITNYPEVRERQLGEAMIKEWKKRGRITLTDGSESKYQFYEDARKIDTYRAIKKVKAPILVVQGDHDEDIPMRHVERLRDALKGKQAKLVVISGADHGYTNPAHFTEMIELFERFLTTNLLQ